jgi:hypothetical protein
MRNGSDPSQQATGCRSTAMMISASAMELLCAAMAKRSLGTKQHLRITRKKNACTPAFDSGTFNKEIIPHGNQF